MRHATNNFCRAGLGLAVLLLAGCYNRPDINYEEARSATHPTLEMNLSTSRPVPVVEAGPRPGGSAHFTTNVGDRVYFRTGDSSLTAEAEAVLRAQALWLQQYPGVNVQIEGHTDPRGEEDDNYNLGERRAQTVAAFLAQMGVRPSRIRVNTFGEERLDCVENRPSCWDLNRRVVTVIEN